MVFQGNIQNYSFLMQSIQLLLQAIRVKSTLAPFQIQSTTDNGFKETVFFFCLWHIWLLPFSPLCLFYFREEKQSHSSWKCIWLHKNKFEASKQMFIKYLPTSKTTVLEYFQCLYADTKIRARTLLPFFFFLMTEKTR